MTRIAPALLAAAVLAVPLTAPLAPGAPGLPRAAADAPACSETADAGDIIRSGHQDLRVLPGNTVVVRDEGVDRRSGTFSFAVPDSARSDLSIPEVGAGFYTLDQAQAPGLPWFGFSTEEISSPVEISIAQAQGPGRIVAWHTQIDGGVDPLLDSADPDTTHSLGAGAHDHVNWAFTEAGTYRAVLRVTVDGVDVDTEVFFLVGDDAVRDGEAGTLSIDCDAEPSPGGASGDDPKQIAKDLNSLTKEFGNLERAWAGFTGEVLKEIGTTAPATTAPSAPLPTPTQAPATRAAESKAAERPSPRTVSARAAEPAPASSLKSTSIAAQAAPGAKAPAAAKKAAAKKAAAKPGKAASATKTAAAPIPDAAQAPRPQQAAPAQPLETEAAAWKKADWWSGLTLGMGISALVAGLLFFSTARRLVAASSRPS